MISLYVLYSWKSWCLIKFSFLALILALPKLNDQMHFYIFRITFNNCVMSTLIRQLFKKQIPFIPPNIMTTKISSYTVCLSFLLIIVIIITKKSRWIYIHIYLHTLAYTAPACLFSWSK